MNTRFGLTLGRQSRPSGFWWICARESIHDCQVKLEGVSPKRVFRNQRAKLLSSNLFNQQRSSSKMFQWVLNKNCQVLALVEVRIQIVSCLGFQVGVFCRCTKSSFSFRVGINFLLLCFVRELWVVLLLSEIGWWMIITGFF